MKRSVLISAVAGVWICALALVVYLAVFGRTSPPDVPEAAGKAGVKRTGSSRGGVTTIDKKGLPTIKTMTPVLDGHLQIPVPHEFNLGSRKKDYIARLTYGKQGLQYPTIIVTGGEPADEDFDEKNLPAHLKTLKAKLQADTLVEAPQAFKIGPYWSAVYVTRANAGAAKLERLRIDVQSSGLSYQIELRAESGTLADFRPFAYAVVAGMTIENGEGEAAPPSEITPAGAAK